MQLCSCLLMYYNYYFQYNGFFTFFLGNRFYSLTPLQLNFVDAKLSEAKLKQKRIHSFTRLYFWSAMIIIKQSIENAISPVMNPMINMTTHLLMLIFSRSCVKKTTTTKTSERSQCYWRGQ